MQGQLDRHLIVVVVSALLLAGLLAVPSMAASAITPGQVDRSFGTGGRVTTATTLGSWNWEGAEVQIAPGPQGTIVAAIDKTVFRYLADGSLDPSFGVGGKLTIADPEGLPFFLSDVAVDPEGRVVLFGEVRYPGVELPASYGGRTIALSEAAVIRHDSTGALDMSLGDGDGTVVTDFDQPHYYQGDSLGERLDALYARAVAGIARGVVDAKGNLILLGEVTEYKGCFRLAARADRRLIARLTPAGDFDPSFGGDGIQAETGFSDIIAFSAARGGGGILAGRASENDPCERPNELIARFGPDGVVDPSFASDGFRPLPLEGPVTAIAVDGNGRPLLLIGAALLRLKRTGGLDRRFGDRGIATVSSPTPVELDSLVPTGHGRTVLVGAHLTPRANVEGWAYLAPRSFALARLNPSGQRERGFGHRGWVVTGFAERSRAVASEAFLDNRGRLVVGGALTRPDLKPTGGIALARYLLAR